MAGGEIAPVAKAPPTRAAKQNLKDLLIMVNASSDSRPALPMPVSLGEHHFLTRLGSWGRPGRMRGPPPDAPAPALRPMEMAKNVMY